MANIEYNDNIAPITNILHLLFNLQVIIPLIHCKSVEVDRASAKT